MERPGGPLVGLPGLSFAQRGSDADRGLLLGWRRPGHRSRQVWRPGRCPRPIRRSRWPMRRRSPPGWRRRRPTQGIELDLRWRSIVRLVDGGYAGRGVGLDLGPRGLVHRRRPGRRRSWPSWRPCPSCPGPRRSVPGSGRGSRRSPPSRRPAVLGDISWICRSTCLVKSTGRSFHPPDGLGPPDRVVVGGLWDRRRPHHLPGPGSLLRRALAHRSSADDHRVHPRDDASLPWTRLGTHGSSPRHAWAAGDRRVIGVLGGRN